MANTRQLATIDEEALIPKRVKKKKPKKTIAEESIQVIVQEMQQMNTLLNAIKKKSGKNDKMSGILNTHFVTTGLPFLDIRSLLNYSATSKQAYINAHEHPIARFSFFSEPARLHLDRAQALSNQVDKKADLVIEITDENNESSKSVLIMTGIGAIITFMPPIIAVSLCVKPFNEGKMSALSLAIITFGSLILGLVIFSIVTVKAYPALRNYFNSIKENNKEDLDLLNQFSELLEKNDFEALENKLHEHLQDKDSSKIKRELTLFPPAEERTNAVSDDKEEAPLLRR